VKATKTTPLCRIHHIPLLRSWGRLSRRKCTHCKRNNLGRNNTSGLCIDCKVDLGLAPPKARKRNGLFCPACRAARKTPLRSRQARINGRLGGPVMTRKKCRKCRRNLLAESNRSGICRPCQRNSRQ
jgi:hypothetical protein